MFIKFDKGGYGIIDFKTTKISDESGVKVLTDKGEIKANKCILTVSTGVLASDQIKFTPNLP